MSISSPKNLDPKQAGMVSIMVTMILMVVISLIVLGFAQISRRNQREVLDRQLSTQAFYAAESGVNDVRDLVQKAATNGQTIPPKTGCDAGSGATQAFYGSLNPVLSASDSVSYTCIMTNPTPTSLVYDDVGSNSILVPVQSANGNAIQNITMTWQSKLTSNTPLTGCPASTSAAFSATSSWSCGYGVLRFDLVPTSGGLSTNGLLTSTMTSFLVPTQTAGVGNGQAAIPYAKDKNNAFTVSSVKCDNTQCSMNITGLSGTQYAMRISSMYQDVSLQLSAQNGGINLPLQNAQVVIDATGKAQDVLRRIQVHVPVLPFSHNQLPDYALQSTDSVCKRFSAMQGYFNNDAAAYAPNSNNPLCQ
jgi:Tfp pilus assembly protein PilV